MLASRALGGQAATVFSVDASQWWQDTFSSLRRRELFFSEIGCDGWLSWQLVPIADRYGVLT